MRRPTGVFTRDDLVRDLVLECDAVVVGSGAGGGVVAAELAEGGLDVVVLEEGGYHPTEEFIPDPGAMTRKLYRDGGATMAVGTPPILFAEGRCVGGSTVVNGGMSWRTPEKVLDRWEREDLMDGVAGGGLDRHFARVEKYISAAQQDPGTIGGDNRLLRQGAEARGWKVVDNIRDQLHCAGTNQCAFGCPTAAKRSTLVSYLPRALAFGARIYADCKVEKVTRAGKRATGVTGHVTRANGTNGARFTVRAPIVVVCAGAVHTPTLLMRSGIRSPSGQLGKNLTLHPNAKVIALFDENVEAWKGVHQAYQVREFQDEGFLMAAVNVPPGVLAMSMPSYGSELHEILSDYNRLVSGGILVEDTVSGQVRVLPGGTPLCFYQLTEHDGDRIVRGTALLAELFFAAGARKVIMPFEGVPILTSPDDIRRHVYAHRIPRSAMEVMTVHIMGTARMGGDPARHVCDPFGKVYDADGLYVADASLFPSPIGVNPMETIMALATRVSERLLETRRAARRAA
jgi:choline dehydrogenase-like flavoprotein